MKRVYGSACEKLYIFPGDWLVLKNFQPVLMKAYYHAGLKDIASYGIRIQSRDLPFQENTFLPHSSVESHVH